MSCYFAYGAPHQDCARCGYQANGRTCGFSICTNTCSSPGGRIHGALCGCAGAHGVICYAHWESHAAEQHGVDGTGGAAGCFPGATAPITVRALSAGIALVSEERTEERITGDEAGSLNEFLNIVTPGHRALRQLLTRLPKSLVRQGGQWAEETEVLLTPAFFGEAALERVIVLAGRALGVASRKDRGTVGGVTRSALTHLHTATLPEFEAWSDGTVDRISDAALATWLPRQSRRTTQHLDYLFSQSGPSAVDDIVRWLLETRTVQVRAH